MKRSIGVRWGKLQVGLLLTAALALALWASLTGGGTSIFESKNEFKCFFRNVGGLLPGSPVWMSGLEVGNVKQVTFVNIDSLRQVEVVAKVKKSVWPMMTEGTQVQIGTIGFLGDKYVEVVPGPKGGAQIQELEIVPTRDVGEASAMFKQGEEAIKDVRRITGNLDGVLGRMNRGEGSLGKLSADSSLYTQLTSLSASLTVLVRELQSSQARITNSIEKTADAVADLSKDVRETKGTVGKLIKDPALYNNLNATSARLDSILGKMNNAQGSLGLLVSDTALYVETASLIKRLNNLVTDMEANPHKYFKFSVF
jgi:phospholipid/cholesterol/gamma-HCH transport system substrate-binding protein